ncbi:hypothetical protein ACN27F_23850 [Solwaraspora sp. WMMB335]|uniref:hypothetical protein n=1 Tax=Solwaraspora sp. WMMB335 TaxID=3404118 RepID=UPI003B959674
MAALGYPQPQVGAGVGEQVQAATLRGQLAAGGAPRWRRFPGDGPGGGRPVGHRPACTVPRCATRRCQRHSSG